MYSKLNCSDSIRLLFLQKKVIVTCNKHVRYIHALGIYGKTETSMLCIGNKSTPFNDSFTLMQLRRGRHLADPLGLMADASPAPGRRINRPLSKQNSDWRVTTSSRL